MSSFEDRLFLTYLDKARTETALLAEEVRSCNKCALRQERFEPLPGAGFSLADILLLKGVVSCEEARGKVAFYGKVAKAIIKAFSKLGLDVAGAYGTNAIKCLPSKDGRIGRDEMRACNQYLKTEIAILEPKIIVVFGSLALKALQTISDDSFSTYQFKRGEIVSWQSDGAVILTHDIDRALAVSQLKEELWQDLKLLRKVFIDSTLTRPVGEATSMTPPPRSH